MDTFLPMIRQPAVWVNPLSYPGGFVGVPASFAAMNKMGVLRKALPTRLYPVDLVQKHTQDSGANGISAEKYDEDAAAARDGINLWF